MSRLTVFLARSLGLFMILLVAGFWLRGGAGIEASVSDGPVLLSYAIISLAMGVAMVVGHNVWSAGALALVVTLVGWLILAKGLVLLVVSPASLAAAMNQMHSAQNYPLYLQPAFVIGLYLAWGASRRKRRAPREDTDVARASAKDYHDTRVVPDASLWMKVAVRGFFVAAILRIVRVRHSARCLTQNCRRVRARNPLATLCAQ